MLLKDRIQLRDELFTILKDKNVIVLNKKINTYFIHRQEKLIVTLLNNSDINKLYNTYINEFRSEEEAIYCLLHYDDYTNHICPICNDICEFYSNRKRSHYEYRNTCCNQECLSAINNSDEACKKREQTNLKVYGHKATSQNEDVKQKMRNTISKNKGLDNPINDLEIQEVLTELNITLQKVNDLNLNFNNFIRSLYIKKNRLLRLKEIAKLFNVDSNSIKTRISQLNLLDLFYIEDSKLELQFEDFLKSNNISYKRRNRDIFPLSDNNGHQEIDFRILNNSNICFEINDIDSHNIKCKDIDYHYSKTKYCLDHNIYLIHLWEWELNESNWSKTSQWILHLLNQSKIRLDLNTDCNNNIRLVDREKSLSFLNQYNLDNRIFDKNIGIYYNDELIQLLSFKDNTLSITVKFGYELVKGIEEVIQLYMKYNHLDKILSYIDLSKFTGKALEEIGFKLLQYQKPNIIYELSNENSTYRKLYNCGYNVYEFSI